MGIRVARFSNLSVCAVLLTGLSFASARATTLTTGYAGGNNQSGNIFDITASNSITITGFEQNFYTGPATDFEIWYRPGGVQGTLTSSGWIELGSVSALTPNAMGTPTQIPLALSLSVAAGSTVGLYLTTTTSTSTVAYTNGTGVGNIAAQNSDLTIYQGYGVAYQFGADYSPRTWNGTIEYTVTGVPEPDSALLLLTGFLGLMSIRYHPRRTAHRS